MAKIFNQCGSERELIAKCPIGISKFEDIDILIADVNNIMINERVLFDIRFLDLKKELNIRRNTFFEKLPSKIELNKKELLAFEKDERNILNYWEKRISLINLLRPFFLDSLLRGQVPLL